MNVLVTKGNLNRYLYGKDGRYEKLSVRLSSKKDSPERVFFDDWDDGDQLWILIAKEPTEYNRILKAVNILYKVMGKIPAEVREQIEMKPEEIALVMDFVDQQQNIEELENRE